MKKQSAISLVAGIAIALAAVFGMRGSEAVAATPALTLDPETGLPAGSLVFHVEDHTCVALPTHELECFCPCASEVCSTQVGIVPELPTATDTVPQTSMDPTTSDTPVLESEPEQESVAPTTSDTPVSELEPEEEPEPDPGEDKLKGNNGLGNGEDPPPPGIAKQGKPQNDKPAKPGNPQYKGSGSDGQPNGNGDKND
jgi:hypothetical protein